MGEKRRTMSVRETFSSVLAVTNAMMMDEKRRGLA